MATLEPIRGLKWKAVSCLSVDPVLKFMENLHGRRGIKLNDQNQNNGSSHQSQGELRSEIKVIRSCFMQGSLACLVQC